MFYDFEKLDELEKLDNIEVMEKQKKIGYIYAKAIFASMLMF